MALENESFLITDLSPEEIRRRLDNDRRLIVPIGACDQYGPHLPLGACTSIAETFARDLSQHCSVLRAPPIHYGVNVPGRVEFPGTASLRAKTLHATMNDLLSSWEDGGIADFILLTVHDYDGHVEAVATATVAGARVRLIELLNVDLSPVIADVSPVQHGGESVTSLMLHLHPERVDMERAVDYVPDPREISSRHVGSIPLGAPGSVGRPRLATAETGRRLYDLIFQKILSRIMEHQD